MKIGSIGYATEQGLGRLVKDFHNQGVITDVLTVKHPKYENKIDWYPGQSLSIKDLDYYGPLFCSSMDIMFFFETPFLETLIKWCKEIDVPTVLMPMYECTPEGLEPDLIINPSALDQKFYPEGEHIWVPVPEEVQWKQREKAKVFVHNAGYGGLNGRNGTNELLEAMKYVKSPIKLILRSQKPINIPTHIANDNRVEVRVGTFPFEDLYKEGDVFIFPEKFNGLSLPLQEAFASGMLVMGTDRFPNTQWLPIEPLIPIEQEILTTPLKKQILTAVLNPKTIATHIDNWFGKDITEYSLDGKAFRETICWRELKGFYMDILLKLKLRKSWNVATK